MADCSDVVFGIHGVGDCRCYARSGETPTWCALEHGSLSDVLGSSLISNGYTAINVVHVLTAIPLSVAFIGDVHRERRRGWLHAIALAWLCGAIVLYSMQEMHFMWLRSR